MRAPTPYFVWLHHATESKVACVLKVPLSAAPQLFMRIQSTAAASAPAHTKPPPPAYRSMPPNRSSKQQYEKQGGSYALLIVPITTFALGCWQIYRLQWKENLIETMRIRGAKSPVDLPENLDRAADAFKYQKVRVRGRFDHARETHIRPRLMLEESGAGGLVSSGGKVGSFVVTPFMLTDGPHRGKTILINRGWVPKARENPETRQHAQIDGEIELVGLMRKSEGGKVFVKSPMGSSGDWQRRDVQAMSQFYGTLPVFLDAVKSSTGKDAPIGGQTHIHLRNNHLQYVVTWWGLSLLTALLWYKKFYVRKNFMR